MHSLIRCSLFRDAIADPICMLWFGTGLCWMHFLMQPSHFYQAWDWHQESLSGWVGALPRNWTWLQRCGWRILLLVHQGYPNIACSRYLEISSSLAKNTHSSPENSVLASCQYWFFQLSKAPFQQQIYGSSAGHSAEGTEGFLNCVWKLHSSLSTTTEHESLPHKGAGLMPTGYTDCSTVCTTEGAIWNDIWME